MTTDRDLTETELGYLGWVFEADTVHMPDVDPEAEPPKIPGWLHLNGVTILYTHKVEALMIASNIARAQGVTPPMFSVGDRVKSDTLTGTVIKAKWTYYAFPAGGLMWFWQYVIKNDVDHPALGEFERTEETLERLSDGN